MSQSSGPLSTTGARMAAEPLKSANKTILRALLSLASAVMLVRVAGMLNQIIVSKRFGAGATMDAYFVASTLPTLIALVMVSALEASVIPVYARVRSQGGKEQASLLLSSLLNILFVGAALLTAVMLVCSRQLILLSAPGLDSSRTDIAIGLTIFLYPVLLLMVVIGFLECILNTEGQFGWPAYAGILVPLTTAAFVLTMGMSKGVVALCLGTLVGLCLQLCVVIVRARRAELIYRPIIDWRSPEVTTVLLAAAPVLVGALISQASPLIDQIFASALPAGSIAALSYALKLVSVPEGVIFASVGRAVLPYLSRQAFLKDMRAFKDTLRLYLWLVASCSLVLSLFMGVLAHPLVQILFQRGAFSPDDTNRTAQVLVAFTVGITPMSLGYVAFGAFSAIGKTRVLLYVTAFSVVTNAVLDYIFAHFWHAFGIALATSAAYFGTMLILIFTLRFMIGRLSLFTPPSSVIVEGIGKIGRNFISWKEEHVPSFAVTLRQQMLRIGAMIAVFAIGVAGIFLNSLYTLRITFGSLVVLALLRYRFVLLLAWVSLGEFIGSNLAVFNGNNFLTGLTAPTLLLLFCMPIKQTFKRMSSLSFLLAYLLWVFLGLGISPIGVGNFLTLWVSFLDYLGVAVLAINVLTTRRRVMALIDVILLVSAFMSLYGIYGYITRQNGYFDPAVSSLFRISSIFDVPPTFALILSLVIPLAIFRTFTLRGAKRIYAIVLTFVLLVALGMTFTRGAYIGVLLSVLVMIFFLPSRRLKIALFASLLALFLGVVLLSGVSDLPILGRFQSQDVETLNGRVFLWQAVISHFDPLQLLGKGLKGSDVLLIKLHVGLYGQGLIATSPHDLFLGTLYDHGIIGLILLILVFVVLLANLIAGIRGSTGEQRQLFVTALAICVNMLVQSTATNDLWIMAVGLYFWIIMVLPFAACWPSPKKPFERDEAGFKRPTEMRAEVIRQSSIEFLPFSLVRSSGKGVLLW